METENRYSEFLVNHPNWIRGFKVLGDNFLHLSNEEKDNFCRMLKNVEFLNRNSIGIPLTLADFPIKEVTEKQKNEFYQRYRELKGVVQNYLQLQDS